MTDNAEPEVTWGSTRELPYPIPVQLLLIDGSSDDLALSVNAWEWDSMEPFQITRKRTLSEGLAAARSALFRIVLLDLSIATLPKIESVTEVLEVAKGLPVVVLINEGGMTNASKAIRLGAQSWVLKGCKSDSLLIALTHAIERQYLMAAIEDGKESIARESHELRNALECIHQFGNILLDGLAGPISEGQCECVGIILQNASRVRIVVENLPDCVSYVSDEFMESACVMPSTIGVS